MHRRATIGRWLCTLLPAVVAVGGCGSTNENGARSAAGGSPAASSIRALDAARDLWAVAYLGEQRVGHSHTVYAADRLGDEPVVRITEQTELPLMRGAQRVEQSVRQTFWETAAGEVRRYECVNDMLNSKQSTTIVVRGESAEAVTDVNGAKKKESIPWPRGVMSPYGVADDLRRNRLAAGQSRQFKVFVPIVNRIADATLRAADLESTPTMPGNAASLLRIDSRLQIAGLPPVDSTFWTDDSGEIIKEAMSGMVKVTTTKELALRDAGGAAADVNVVALVPVSSPIVQPADSTYVRYRLRVTDGDAAAVFRSCEYQTVVPRADGGGEATVRALRPGSASNDGYVSPPPTAAERSPGPLVQSDDPLVRRMAAEAAGDATDPWTVAVRLEGYVHARMRPTGFSPAFAGAAETARSLVGDCTEHAVLLCALLRARSIPARTALGLVYVEAEQAFGYHLWTEAYIGGRWIPLDAVAGRGGTSAAYLKVGDADLSGVDAYAALLPVIGLLGKLQIDVIEQR